MISRVITVFWIILTAANLYAQGAQGTHSGIVPDLSSDTLTLGKPINLNIQIPVSPGIKITPPERTDFYPLSVIRLDIARAEGGDLDTLVVDAEVTRYDTDSLYVPKLPFVIKPEVDSGLGDTVFTDRVDLVYRSVIDAQKGDTVDIKDLKPLQEAGTPPPVWLWVVSALITIALIILAVVFLGNYRKKEETIPSKPPYEEAVESLKELSMKKMIENGLFRAYVFELSAILKRYLGRRYRINASEFTTDEMIEWAENCKFKTGLSERIAGFFRDVHPVKFAKLVPEKPELTEMTKQVWSIVEETRPVEKEDRNGV